MLVMARASLSAAEAVSLRADAATELPSDVREAVEAYLRLDRARRETLKTAGPRAWLFQPVVNYRTLEFDRPLSRRSAEMIVKHWGEFAGLGRVTPKMLRGALEGAPAES